MDEILKKCNVCGQKKNIADFPKNKGAKDGYKNQCKSCIKLKAKNRYLLICKFCGNAFRSDTSKQEFCSHQCAIEFRKKDRVKIKCTTCNKIIYRPKSLIHNANFCSKVCLNEYLRIKMQGENNPVYSSISTICDYCGKNTNVKKTVFEKNKHNYCSRSCCNKHKKVLYKESNSHSWNGGGIIVKCDSCGKQFTIKKHLENKKHHYCSKKCAGKGYKKLYSGKNNKLYDPSKTLSERIHGRYINGYRDFIKSVYERDHYTCQCCGDDKGGNLVAHHLNGYHWAKNERVKVENGVTLCNECHKKFHKLYGNKFNTKKQFDEFKKTYSN